MAKRHHATMEVGGWVLLAAALAYLVYLLCHRDGQAALSGGTVVSSKVGGVTVGPPTVRPNDPTQLSTYVDDQGNLYLWDPNGAQWHASGVAPVVGPPVYLGGI